jgi:hypothetical protein
VVVRQDRSGRSDHRHEDEDDATHLSHLRVDSNAR